MTKFHISKNGLPAPCRAKDKSCPLGSENEHFSTEKEAQAHIDNLSSEKYGALPEMKTDGLTDGLTDEWRSRFLEHKNFDDFASAYASKVVSEGIFDKDADLYDASLDKWEEVHNENSLSQLSELEIENSVSIVKDNIDSSTLHGWFREYNSDYKPRINQAIITNPELRNASLNIAYANYKEVTGKDITYNEFLNEEIEIYRGGNFDMINNDEFVSYSFDKSIAEKFASAKQGSEVRSLKIKMSDTLGSLQTTGEAEVMVRRKDTNL